MSLERNPNVAGNVTEINAATRFSPLAEQPGDPEILTPNRVHLAIAPARKVIAGRVGGLLWVSLALLNFLSLPPKKL